MSAASSFGNDGTYLGDTASAEEVPITSSIMTDANTCDRSYEIITTALLDRSLTIYAIIPPGRGMETCDATFLLERSQIV